MKEQLSLELTKRKINVVKTAKRNELIRELELAITNNIEIIQDTSDASEEKGASEEKENTNIICNSFQDFPLESGWALKSKQKYGKRGSGKRLSKRVSVSVSAVISPWALDWFPLQTYIE
ncbi:unnamed protein product [Rhizophagus irregularis]|nr:unnamed protein product [Rhizophagus irregularis]